MDKVLHDLIERLEGLAIRTESGSYVSLEDIRRLADEEKNEPEVPQPKTMYEAKQGAREYLKTLGFEQTQDAGRAIPATEPQPSSRT